MTFFASGFRLCSLRYLLALLLGLTPISEVRPVMAEEADPVAPWVNRQSVNDTAGVLGFLIGQDMAISAISRQHPDLATALRARAVMFDATYGNPMERVETFLKRGVGDQLPKLQEEITAGLAPLLDRQIPRYDAETFLREMDERIEGRLIRDNVLATMLWLKFQADPVVEMDEWAVPYSSAGHPKALGLDVRLKLPRSWKGEEGERPHIVRKWTSQNGAGLDMIMLTVFATPKQAVTLADLQAEVDATGAAGFALEDHRVTDAATLRMDRQPALRVDQEGMLHSMERVMQDRFRTYLVFTETAMLQIQCMASAEQDSPAEALQARFEGLKRLCDRVAGSFVLPQQYE
ncbi:hypothetical protein LAZ40_01170 [Cereibacter sphaeroides]|uniref:hypothetical protein n=1 Tax=Cereibacter sphaeroides TaxID=1063 RepID=UPI001F41BB4B|nr:hypothetical protein [Cereibacter sphaeroides]MCE6957677.1 hypothetical protein [Cereibacter sphaeroides]MCE6971403.1 hypothetical protein [Cereibacter sphaeroides]